MSVCVCEVCIMGNKKFGESVLLVWFVNAEVIW
jgi:hypothetical protein